MAGLNSDNLFPKPSGSLITVRQALNCVSDDTYTVPRSYRQWTAYLKPTQCVAALHPKGFGFNIRKLAWDQVAFTVTRTHTPAVGLIHPGEDRFLSPSEVKRIMSFPDQFIFAPVWATDAARIRNEWALMGNAVPPLMAYSISSNLRNLLGYKMDILEPGDQDYLTILNKAWQQHLAPRADDAPTVISTFAGCGGSSLGYSMAGFRELLAVEWNDNAVATFKLNFPDVPVYHGDIAKLSVEECLELTGLEPGQLDVLDGSPPCQGFSTAGKRDMADDRNQLFREYVRLLRGLQPRAFVMENVSGLVKGKMKLVFAEIMRELKASGYNVKCRLMNAMYFQVPQSRQRLIWIGLRDDLGIEPEHPRGQSKPISVKEAIELDGHVTYRHSWSGGKCKHRTVTFGSPAPAMIKTASMYDWRVYLPAPSLSDKYKQYWEQAAPGGRVGKYNCATKLNPDEAAPTITKAEGYGGAYHPREARGLSTGERKRLSSFPDQFQFTDWKSAVERIGNSVPPLFMRAIAQHVSENIL